MPESSSHGSIGSDCRLGGRAHGKLQQRAGEGARTASYIWRDLMKLQPMKTRPDQAAIDPG
jgi:hypothetical protein